MSGYYISSPHTIKNNQAEKRDPGLLANIRTVDANDKNTIPEDKRIAVNPNGDLLPAYSTEKRTSYAPENITDISGKEGNFKVQNKRNSLLKPVSGDDKKIRKDVKNLLLSSAGAFVLALLYGIFSIAGIQALTNIIFILTPFAIIGIWIYALLLYTKYSTSDPSSSTEQKPKEERIIKKSRAFLLAGFLGIFGVHRFYLGYTKMGILEMLTLGGFFVLYFIDLIHIKEGKLKPKKGNYDPEQMVHTKVKKSKLQNTSLKLIKIAALISLAALIIILGFTIFF